MFLFFEIYLYIMIVFYFKCIKVFQCSVFVLIHIFSAVFVQHLMKGVHYRWGFFAPSGCALDEIRDMVDAKQV